jgi:hypothetical protein
MVPDETEQSASEQPQAPGKGRRRSRRGGRRHSRRREPRAAEPAPVETEPQTPPESVPPVVEESERLQENFPEEASPAGRQRSQETHEGRPSRPRGITEAIEQVNGIIEELKHALDEMEEVLETLELAERQKIDDEREIDNLQRALRQLRRPREGHPHH